MNYFDDIKISYVGKAVSNTINEPHKVSRELYGIGMLLGKDHVYRANDNTSKIMLKMPFLYLIYPEKTSAAWQSINGTPRDNRWFIFEGPRAERMVETLKQHIKAPSPVIPLKNFSELILIHQKMYHLYLSGIPTMSHQLALCAEEFMGAIYDALNTPEIASPIIQLLTATINEITEAPGKDYDFKAIVKQHKISYYHFRRCFVQYTGIPIHEFVLQKRLALAILQLKRGMNNIKEIADQCGFRTASDFSRFIKERTGSTPSELRNKIPFVEI